MNARTLRQIVGVPASLHAAVLAGPGGRNAEIIDLATLAMMKIALALPKLKPWPDPV